MARDRADSLYDPAEAATPGERRSRQAGRLRAAVAAAYARAPGMRARMEGCGLDPDRIRAVEDLAPLPVLRKDSLPLAQSAAPPFGALLAAPVATLRRIYVSPGPIYDPEPRTEDPWRMACALHAAGFRAGDVVLVTFSFHLTPAGHMVDAGLDRLRCVVVPGGVGSTDVQARSIADLEVTGFAGTPSFLVTLLERAAALGYRHGLEVAFVAGEPLSRVLRRRVEDEFRVRVVEAYASADAGLIAYEYSARDGMHVSEDLVVEILDPDTARPVERGAPGEVVLSVLNSPYALIRFGTGDLAAELPGVCPCGRTAPRLGGIIGRVGAAVKIRGLFVHPAEVEGAVRRFQEVLRYQIVVTRPADRDEATLRLEVAATAHARDVAPRVARAMLAGLRLRLDVEAVAPGTIPDGAPAILDLRQRG